MFSQKANLSEFSFQFIFNICSICLGNHQLNNGTPSRYSSYVYKRSLFGCFFRNNQMPLKDQWETSKGRKERRAE